MRNQDALASLAQWRCIFPLCIQRNARASLFPMDHLVKTGPRGISFGIASYPEVPRTHLSIDGFRTDPCQRSGMAENDSGTGQSHGCSGAQPTGRRRIACMFKLSRHRSIEGGFSTCSRSRGRSNRRVTRWTTRRWN